MFDSLSEKLALAIKNVRGYGIITEDNINEILREVRLALLSADVNFVVVKEFTNKVREKALGVEVRKSLNPSDEFVKIVHDEIQELLGSSNAEINLDKNPSVILMSGLQGSGKTTTSGKLALLLRKKYKKNPLLVACDVYRPAAINQLREIGLQLNVDVYHEDIKEPVTIAKNALVYAKEKGFDVVIIDTAGRLHIDSDLMLEIKNISNEVNPTETFLVIDSMMGQDAINVINGFNETLNLSGAILTKLDGDTKGGVALSVRHLTNVPIKFVGVSEKMDGLDIFYPDRMASRILGMGDVLSLVEQVSDKIDNEEAKKAAAKMKKGNFDLNDFLNQMQQIKKLGSIESLIKMIPGAKKMGLSNVNVDKKQMARLEAIISSMTLKERRDPSILKASHKIRIAKGSGTSVQEVNRLINQFSEMKKMMKQFSNGNFKF